ncbi:hypothetical protein SAMN05444285_101149 [Draconibacterium orientale]|uniref:Uncharacterized protein n=1 Tax=Draconibacterium orientale TaxID=1168034 RepID=X5E6F1_9BACT|nr:hypothetical protein [Draconibacterium orientale]AHW62216.1 hypothetical protein FH5T_17630 [Draconibacterium orientale]SES67289.1 hypothetical protein SAMN05444285_101149 [Draconibacterium orientale]
MKKVNLFFRCVADRIKKKFFKGEKNDNSQACVELQNMEAESKLTADEIYREEYAKNYCITTRWQTV